ncbi:tRNA 4-thiouridine(8) synthase ThiI [Patescibacteria group bacterium]|nr:tRNA 4-thiouridine(8) synthase ThiI [Patescibacteria group bacterium]
MESICIIHYGEIGLKGRNRIFFEKKLINNIELALKNQNVNVKRSFGRLIVELHSDANENKVRNILTNIYGIENFHFGYQADAEISKISKIAIDILSKNTDWQTFCIQTKRSTKQFPMTSVEISKEVGGFCLDTFPEKKVKLQNPDKIIFIEIVNDLAYVLDEKIKGSGGMPIGSSAPVLALLSGGIDSPVASRLLMKRGCPVHFIHFHSQPYTNKFSTEKVKELARLTIAGQQKSSITLVPIIELQKSVMSECNEEYRVLLYRRFMLRLAEHFAKKMKIRALATGESIGQVASQTIENIAAVHSAISIPVLQPLICFDKKEIVEISQKIGTYETSILPHEDCCTVFMPKNPATKASEQDLKKQEERLDLDALLKISIDNSKQLLF